MIKSCFSGYLKPQRNSRGTSETSITTQENTQGYGVL